MVTLVTEAMHSLTTVQSFSGSDASTVIGGRLTRCAKLNIFLNIYCFLLGKTSVFKLFFVYSSLVDM